MNVGTRYQTGLTSCSSHHISQMLLLIIRCTIILHTTKTEKNAVNYPKIPATLRGSLNSEIIKYEFFFLTELVINDVSLSQIWELGSISFRALSTISKCNIMLVSLLQLVCAHMARGYILLITIASHQGWYLAEQTNNI